MLILNGGSFRQLSNASHQKAQQGIQSNGRKMELIDRLLGIPTVIDRMLQQAVSRTIMPQYEYMFSCYSYGFRPQRNTHQAIRKSLDYIGLDAYFPLSEEETQLAGP